MSLKLKLRPAKILETLNFAPNHQLPYDSELDITLIKKESF